jgi:hypothetical protein
VTLPSVRMGDWTLLASLLLRICVLKLSAMSRLWAQQQGRVNGVATSSNCCHAAGCLALSPDCRH